MAKSQIKVQKPNALVDRWGLNMFLTGQPGTGKTLLIGSAADLFPNGVLILDVEGGMRTLADREDIDIVHITSWKQILDVREALDSDHPYKVVAIDLIPEGYRLLLEDVMAEGARTGKGQPTQEAYGVANTRFIKTLRDFRALSVDQGVHVVFTSHATETKDEDTGVVLVRPNLTPGTLNSVIGSVDVVGYMELTRKQERLLHLVGSNKFWAKARVPASYGEVPESISVPREGGFAQLLKVLGGDRLNKA